MFYPYAYVNFLLGFIFLACIVLAVLSLWWTSRRERKILGGALGRKVREEDETSLKTWMNLRADQLADAERDLARNPFDRPLDALERVGDALSREPRDQ